MDRKTIIFNLEILISVMLRKNETQGYDASAYVKLFGQNPYKLYLNYRPYLKEMLNDLKKDFELILMGSKDIKYVEKIVQTL